MLSIIEINLQAKVDNFNASMVHAADTVDAQMARATGSADQFQTNFDRASQATGASAAAMAGDIQAANDEIIDSAKSTTDALNKVSDTAKTVDVQTWKEKVANAFGQGFGAGAVAAQSWMDTIQNFVETKLVLLGIAIAAGVTFGAVAAIYTAYKVISASLGFLVGLFTGDSYKSADIDALIKLNDEVLKLQGGLHIAAEEASALNEALKAKGVDASGYVSTLNAATSAARNNTDELDRLGVKYKDANGALLSQSQILQNAKAVLDSYTEGYDRNAAAAAIAMGGYEEISKAVSVTSADIDAARDRLIDYQLIIGPGTQEAIASYQQAMRDFSRETDLQAQGFKKAFADQIMPALTEFAEWFKDGFPFVVGVFRYTLATVTTLFWGLENSAYLVVKGIAGSFETLGDVVGRVAGAMAKVVTGDFKGAVNELLSAPKDIAATWASVGDDVVQHAEKVQKALALAWGADNINAATGPAPQKKLGKTWQAAPSEDDGADTDKALLDARLKALDAAIAEENDVLKSREEMLTAFHQRQLVGDADYYSALQSSRQENLRRDVSLYQAELAAVMSYRDTWEKGEQEWIQADQRAGEIRARIAKAQRDEALATQKSWVEQNLVPPDNKGILDGQLKALDAQVATEGNTLRSRQTMLQTYYTQGYLDTATYYERLNQVQSGALAANQSFYAQEIVDIRDYQAKYQAGSKEWQEAANRMVEVQAKLAAADQAAAEASQANWLAQSALTAEAGMTKAFADYQRTAGATAASMQGLFNNAFRGMEDALVNFVRTGSLNFHSLADSIISDLIRIQIQESITKPLASALSSPGTLASLASLVGFAKGGVGDSPGLSAYSGGVYSSPHVFAFASGAGVFGEAGPEAIMPLTRSADGSLGVRAVGGGGGVVVNITESPGNGGQVTQSQSGGVNVIDILVDRVRGAVGADIAKGGPLANLLQTRYGLSPAAGAVR